MEKKISPKKLNQILKKYKGEEGVLIPILQETQAVYGYLPPSLLEYMSEELHISLSRIYGIVTFYTQFRLKPWGRNIIKVCHGTVCHVSGVEEISRALSDELKIEEGETTSDLKFTLMSVRCVGCCSLAPVMMINEKTYGRLTPQSARKVVKSDEWEGGSGKKSP